MELDCNTKKQNRSLLLQGEFQFLIFLFHGIRLQYKKNKTDRCYYKVRGAVQCWIFKLGGRMFQLRILT